VQLQLTSGAPKIHKVLYSKEGVPVRSEVQSAFEQVPNAYKEMEGQKQQDRVGIWHIIFS
jgi:hypothetical protein